MIGLVVLNYNDYETTIQFLEQIRNYQCLDYICIVDNASTDSSLKEMRPITTKNIELLSSPKNNGYSYGNNIGAKYLIEEKGCNYIFISNPDIETTEETMKQMISKIEKDTDIAVLGPTIYENGEVNRGWKLPSVLNDIFANIPVVYKLARKKLIYNQENYNSTLTKVEVVSGCFFLIKSEVLKELDYFDENTFLYYEENILGKKLKDKNYQSYILNNAKVVHQHSVSIDKSFAHLNKIKILKRSQRYYQKNYNNASFIGIIGLYISYYIYILLSYSAIAIKKVVK